MKKIQAILLTSLMLAILSTGCQTKVTTGKFPRYADVHPPKAAFRALVNGEHLSVAHRLAIVNYAKKALKVQRERDCAARIWNHEKAKDCFR